MSMISVRRRPVKPTRVSERPAAPFGQGLFKPVPVEPQADLMPQRVRWHALHLTTLEDLHFDELATEAAARDCLERGLIPREDSWNFGHQP
jgi:hypothetical protein